MNTPDATPALHHGALRHWLTQHPRCDRAALAALEYLLHGQPPQAIVGLHPEVVFFKHPKHMQALIRAGFDFTTMTVTDLLEGDIAHMDKVEESHSGSDYTRTSRSGEEVRKFALYLNAQESVHVMLDALGIPPVPEKEASKWITDVMRNDWLNSLRHLHHVYPHHVERWAGPDITLSMMAVNAWTERPTKNNDAMLVDVITWGMPVDKFRSVVKDIAPKHIGSFERLVSVARAKMLENIEDLHVTNPKASVLRL